MNYPQNKRNLPKDPKQTPKKGRYNYKTPNSYSFFLILAVILTAVVLLRQARPDQKLRWDQFVEYVQQEHIDSIKIKDSGVIVGKFTADAPENPEATFKVSFNPDIHGEWLSQLLKDNDVKNDYVQTPAWVYAIFQLVLFVVVLFAIFYFLIARNVKSGAGGMLMSFGRSKHKLHGKDKVKVTFNDVAGIEEAKEEVGEIIEFLKNPKKFQKLGGRIPRGVLLIGPPGCGKTLLAKAIAGQADVPFFSISGSDFVEMFVGVGASRVRDLFRQAKENSPCIIFLDEIDAIGRKRGAGYVGGGHDEREQTLNAILVEMDGFDTNDQVIVIAATNRGDMLDHALTRPGRFDRQVIVPLPDLHGRLEILKVHAKKVKLNADADLERLARGTPMFSGADLAAIINEAALAATMSEKDFIETPDLEEARDKVRWGKAKKSRFIDEHDRKVTAYHEAGHTLIQYMLEDADPLHKVSIIPRGPMGGATFTLPEKDRTMYTKRYCMALMQVCFGGRIAEEIFCDDISSGAQNDIMQATRVAKQMILTWGMSDNLGLISYDPDAGFNQKSYFMPTEREFSEKTAEQIDNEIKKITDEAYKTAKELILANKDKLENVANALLKYETLDVADVKIIFEGGTLDKPTVADLLAAEKEKTKSQTVSDDNEPDQPIQNRPNQDQTQSPENK